MSSTFRCFPQSLLLRSSADVNGNALQSAAFRGNKRMVQHLLDRGGDINAQGGYFENACYSIRWSISSASSVVHASSPLALASVGPSAFNRQRGRLELIPPLIEIKNLRFREADKNEMSYLSILGHRKMA